MRDGTHSSSCLAPVLAFFGFTAPLFGAISQIRMGTGGESARGCEFGNARAKEEDEMANWQRWEREVRRCSYKALPQLLHSMVFGKLLPRFAPLRILCNIKVGRYLGFRATTARIADFISAICYGSPNIRRLLRQPLRLSNYYCTAITPVFSL